MVAKFGQSLFGVGMRTGKSGLNTNRVLKLVLTMLLVSSHEKEL